MRVVQLSVRSRTGAIGLVAVALVLGIVFLAVGFVLALSAAAVALVGATTVALYRPLGRKRAQELEARRRPDELDPALEVFSDKGQPRKELPRRRRSN